MSTTLPSNVRAALVKAAAIDSRFDPDGTCAVRNAAVEFATVAARAAHPEFFQEVR